MMETPVNPPAMPTITPEPAFEPDKHRQLPWLAVTLSFLVLSVLGVLGYQNLSLKKQIVSLKTASLSQPTFQISPSPTPDPTANWETYTDSINKFSIKYPKDKIAVLRTKDAYMEFCNVGSSIVSIELYNQGQRIPPPEVAIEFTGFLATTIATKTLSSGLSPREWTQINCKGNWVADPSTQVDRILLNGSWLTIYTGGQMGTGSFVVYPKDDRIYLFYGWPVTTIDQMNIFDQILSTFKFINQ